VLPVGSGLLYSSPGVEKLRKRRNSMAFLPRKDSSILGTPFLGFDSAKLGKQRRKIEDVDNGGVTRGLLFGFINAAVLIPGMVGFASIIYKDSFFTEPEHNFLPMGIKLVFLSSGIHQLCFAMFSSLGFAVGQVQDAGLIFLSSMAVTIVSNMQTSGASADPSKVMSTTVVSLSLCTGVLGLLLVLLGKLKLARLVQYLPLPVVGGYLAYIGLFCGLSGLHLATGDELSSILDIRHLLNSHSITLLLPAIGTTTALIIVSKKAKGNPFVFPLCLILMPAIFFLVLKLAGNSLDDAREYGWICQKTPVPEFVDVVKLFNFEKVDWGAAFPSVLPTFFAMFAVVAFGSSLDVAAIQFELGEPLDYDSELVTVGISNVVSGFLGGYTGSYIFSQTIFTLRNGVKSRVGSFVIVVVELTMFFAPIDLMSMLPRFIFGSVFLVVALELMVEWLVLAYFALEKAGFAVVWLTFIFINIWGLEGGMALGFVCSALLFVYNYSSSSNVEVLPNAKSLAVRSGPDRRVLQKERSRIVALSLSGYQFFGTVIGTIIEVQQHVVVSKVVPANCDEPISRSSNLEAQSQNTAQRRANELHHSLLDGVDEEDYAPVRSASLHHHSPRLLHANSDISYNSGSGRFSLESGLQPSRATKQLRRLYEGDISDSVKSCKGLHETQYVVLDMSRASGVDATSARACFYTILQSLNNHGIQLVFAGLNKQMELVLRVNGVISPSGEASSQNTPFELESLSDNELGRFEEEEEHYASYFPTMEQALEWCEEQILAATTHTEASLTRHSFFDTDRLKAIKAKYFEEMELEHGEMLFEKGELADKVYVLETGRIGRKDANGRCSDCSLVGLDAFYLSKMHEYTAIADRYSKLFTLSRESAKRMEKEEPALAIYLYKAFYKVATE